MGNIKLNEIPSEIKWKIRDCFILHRKLHLKALLIKSYMIQLPVLLYLVVLHQRRTSFIIIGKKIFFMSFLFFHGFIPTSLTTTPPDVQDGFKTMLLQLILLASNQLKVVQTKLLIMHSLPSFEREWVCQFKKKNLRTNSVDRRNLTKNWEWPKALSKVKSYFVISALNMLFGAFYRLMRPGRLHWNCGNCRICGNFAFPPKPNIYLPL